MAYNMSFNKGKYPGEPGYSEWTGFEVQMKIPGTTPETYVPIFPLDFHKKMLDNRTLPISRGNNFTDYQIRLNIEMEKNKRYFQPRKWDANKLLYNYNMIYHSVNNAQSLNDRIIRLLRKHIKWLYDSPKYKIEDKDRISLHSEIYKARAFYPQGKNC
jgi:hypothetical protein|tara:strand:+ start:176 stop:649 length:474 start_codon:yes stop_codon:yes gene_type:complete